MDVDGGLEAAAMNPADALQAFRLAAHAVFDDWRQDPAVTTKAIQQATNRAAAFALQPNSRYAAMAGRILTAASLAGVSALISAVLLTQRCGLWAKR